MSNKDEGRSEVRVSNESIENLLVAYLAPKKDDLPLRFFAYLPFIQALIDVRSGVRAADLQAGSGDWLHTLQQRGVIARGAEASNPLFSICASRGLNVINTDWLSYIRSLEKDSQDVVSCFGVLDQLLLNDVEILMLEAQRVLAPGGLLILDLQCADGQANTLENGSIYLNPQFLTFALKHYGFSRTKLLAVKSKQSAASANDLSLEKVLLGSPKRCALISQKVGYEGDQKRIDSLFSEEKFERYDDAIKRFDRALVEVVRHANEKARLYDAIVTSTSWRVMAPFRQIATFIRLAVVRVKGIRRKLNSFTQEFKISALNIVFEHQFTKNFMAHADAYVVRRPKLLALLLRGLQVLPERLRYRIKKGLSLHRMRDAVKIRAYQRSERGRYIYQALLASAKKTSQSTKVP